MKKKYTPNCPIEISPEKTREEIIQYLATIRDDSVTADLAFYAYRDMDNCDWAPFIKAAIERNPVAIESLQSKSLDEVYKQLNSISDDSIYDANRLAQPDEVINFNSGDGIEKAILMANIIRSRNTEQNIEITIDRSKVVLIAENKYHFSSKKSLVKKLSID